MPSRPLAVSPDAPNTRVFAVLWCRRVSRVGSLLAGLMALTVLAGYALRWEWAVRVLPGLPPMYLLTAIALAALAAAVFASQSTRPVVLRSGVAVSVAVAAIAITILGLHISEADPTGIDLFVDDFVASTTVVPGRPVAETGLSLLLLAVSTMFLGLRRCPQVGQVLAMAGAAIGASAAVGYALDRSDSSFRDNAVLVGMALNTAICLFLLGVAAVLARPDVGLVGRLVAGGAGAEQTRRLTALVALGPLALLVCGALIYAVAPSDDFAAAAYSVVQVGVLGALVLVPAASVADTEGELRQHLQQLRRDAESADDVDVVVREILADTAVPWEVDGWEVGVRLEPARGHLAGDFFVVSSTGRRTLVAVVDVAGHDAQSAVVAYGVRTVVRALWEHGATLDEVVEAANRKAIRRRTIATGVFAEITEGVGTIRYINAGHPAPVHLGAATARWTTTGPLLGVPSPARTVAVAEISVGEVVALFTDGIEETRSDRGQLMGDHPLTRMLTASLSESAQTIADRSVDTALSHTDRRLNDDVLVLVLRRLR